ncbi:hypothetical protein [Arenicella chitinivorans]|nr:hypothetical protein [Arenicella chitinivorans]
MKKIGAPCNKLHGGMDFNVAEANQIQFLKSVRKLLAVFRTVSGTIDT